MPEKMGETTQLAYNFIKEDLLIMNDELDPMDVLDFLDDEENFKRISGLLKETMITAGIPSETCELIKEYSTVGSFLDDVRDKKITPLNESDSPSSFANALYSLLSKQEGECEYQNRKKPWAKITITRWFSEDKKDQESKSRTSESIKNRDDAIAICFALGLDYPASRDFLNKSGHDIFNIRCSDDAVYIYCLINHRPLSVAKELIHKYEDNLVSFHVPEEDIMTHSGNTTILMANQILGNSNWENDDDFYNSFMIPNIANFINYSRTALIEYYKIKNPVYLLALKKIVSFEKDDSSIGGFDKRKIQEYIHKTHKDREITIPMSSVQVTYNFINYLPKFSSSDLLKSAQDMFDDIRVERIDDGWNEEAFITVNNSLDVIDYIINNYSTYSNNETELKIISDFLTKTVTPYRMLCTWLPSVVNDDEDGSRYIIDNDGNIRKLPSLDYYEEVDNKHIRDKYSNTYEIRKTDKRHRSLSESDHLADSVFRHFPQRNFFSKYENHPEEIVHNISLRKAIILLYYMNYSINLIQEISNPNTIDEEFVFGFDDFYESLNSILGKCQLGKLYCANPFDWLILESIKRLENYSDDDDMDNPITFLDDVLSYALDLKKEDD